MNKLFIFFTLVSSLVVPSLIGMDMEDHQYFTKTKKNTIKRPSQKELYREEKRIERDKRPIMAALLNENVRRQLFVEYPTDQNDPENNLRQ